MKLIRGHGCYIPCMAEKAIKMNPINGALRFLLELTAIFCFGLWGYHRSDSGLRFLFALLLPIVFALLWGIFAVRDDPSRSGKTVVSTSGWIRLLLELGLFSAATLMLLDLKYTIAGEIFGALVLFHYAISHRRIAWLLKQK